MANGFGQSPAQKKLDDLDREYQAKRHELEHQLKVLEYEWRKSREAIEREAL